jgi:cytochrome P450
LQAELDAIKKSKPEGELLTLEDLKKMTLTTWVSVPLSSKMIGRESKPKPNLAVLNFISCYPSGQLPQNVAWLQTMNETLRMVNVVTWFAGRTSEKDTQIKGKQAHYF